MVTFFRRRLQVFVSSTYSDLLSERQAAVEAILTAGHIPAGMELFTAGDESQMDVIRQWIDESDVYLLILAGRYGSIEPTTGKSYTQLEYEYALGRGKPLFACVITEEALEERARSMGRQAFETVAPQQLTCFRDLVLTRLSRFWADPKDIKITISETLAHFARREELTGWVRGDRDVDVPALADEIARLSKDNAQLRSRLEKAAGDNGFLGMTFQELRDVLESTECLKFLRENRLRMLINWIPKSNHGREHTRELTYRGILEPTTGRGVRLTDLGKRFLNMLDRDSHADDWEH